MTKQHFTYDLQPGNASNYEVKATLSSADVEYYKKKTLKDYQKDVTKPGFRKGHVPLNMVEEMIYPQYITMGIAEYLINDVLHHLIDEKGKDIKFIGEPYNIDVKALTEFDDTKDEHTMSFALDVYPECETKDEQRKDQKPKQVSVAVDEKDIQETIKTIQKQYADYEEVETIDQDSVVRVSVEFFDKEDASLHKKHAYLTEKEWQHETLKESFMTHKAGDEVVLDYSALKGAPASFVYQGKELPTKVVCTIESIKTQKLPEMTDTFVKEKFGGKDETGVEITTVKQLEDQIRDTISTRTEMEEIQKSMNDRLQKVKQSFTCVVPKTFIDSEYEERVKHMKKQLGGEQQYEKFMEQMGEQKRTQYQEDMKKSVKDTLENFLVFQEVLKQLDYKDIDATKPGEANEQLYKKFYAEKKPQKQKKEKKENKENKEKK